MADLKVLFEKEGFENVLTYIQSGNVIFNADVGDRSVLKSRIESAVERKYRFHVPVDIRTNREIKRIIASCPFPEASNEKNGTKVLVTFLRAAPQKSKVAELMRFVKSPEKLAVRSREVFLYCPNGYGKSKLTTTFLEAKLGVEATTRNWKTVQKLNELSI